MDLVSEQNAVFAARDAVSYAPFLRAPPFLDVPSQVAAISRSGAAAACSVDDALLARIAREQVGGAFWGHRPQGVKIVARQGIEIPLDVYAGLAEDEIGILPNDSGGAGAIVHGSAVRILPVPCDLWALVAGARSVHASPEDELAIIAGLVGVPVMDGDGRLVPEAQLREIARGRVSEAVYRNCFSGEAADISWVIQCLADWRRHLDGNRDIAAASGIAFWKRQALRRFLWDGLGFPPFLSVARGLARARKRGGSIAVWPSRVPTTIADQSAVPVVRIEDGFLRSKGLGAALHPPGSVVVDRSGIYYNARAESDLERLLATHDFTTELVERAAQLRARICDAGVTKYGQDAGHLAELPRGRRTVLAVGQVDDDLSVRLGGAGVGGNLDFLERVRRAEPDAWIIYRPHPDVQAGHRKGHLSEAAVLRHADMIDAGAPLMALVQMVDEVHILSSLTGFEALLRGCSVTVHGMPFYAGWGLTRDLATASPRRGRRLTIDQLVAGALILYPRYLDPVTALPCGPEVMVNRLASGSMPPMTSLIRLRMLQGKLRRFMTLFAEFLHG